MDRQQALQRISDAGLIAIIRADSSDGLVETCRALAAGGVTVAEVTMTTPGALECIRRARQELGEGCLIGVGSVLSGDVVRQAVDAGAQFVVAPTFKAEVVDASHECGVPVAPGAFTPTEILTAFEHGADVVKVFPANHLGPKFFKDILAPMPHLKLTPTGGVDLTTIPAWFEAGAVALGVGSNLVKKDLIKAEKWKELTDLASQFTAAVKQARAGKP